jgi:Na+/melibiose symporter-like transporter
MTTVPDTEFHRRPLVSSEPAPLRNSPLLYGLGSFGLESAYKAFWGFYVFYYVDVLGLAVTLAALINVVYGIGDAVNDPLVGYLSDNTRTRWGRRRPWPLMGLPFYVGFLVLTYAIPAPFQQGQGLFGYVSGAEPGPDPGNAFRFLIGVFPFLFLILALVLSWRLELEGDKMRADDVHLDNVRPENLRPN